MHLLAASMLTLSLATQGAPESTACSKWTLDGYVLGMRGDALLAVRSVTLHVKGQAQVVQPGKLHGVLVLDDAARLEKWDVYYEADDAGRLRAELTSRLGSPVADVAGTLLETETASIRQRRTIWREAACDAAILVYEDTASGDKTGKSVRATLVRASILPEGLFEAKSISP